MNFGHNRLTKLVPLTVHLGDLAAGGLVMSHETSLISVDKIAQDK